MSRAAPWCGSVLIALVAALLISAAPTEAAWRAVTEAGVTYQAAASPIESSPWKPTHWHWTGVLGAVRTIGAWDAIGPTLIGSYSESDYMIGLGLRWEHTVAGDWTVTATPGIAAHDLVKTKTDFQPGYFGELGLSYRRLVTVAVRQDAVRYVLRSDLDWDVPEPTVTGHVWRYDVRLAGKPGTWALGVAAVALLVAGAEATTDAH